MGTESHGSQADSRVAWVMIKSRATLKDRVVRFFWLWRSAALTKQADHNEEAENGTKGFIPRRCNCWDCVYYF
jgi:hypothetical protein